MANRHGKASQQRPQSQLSIPLIVLGAFALDAGLTWLAMRGATAGPERLTIQDFATVAPVGQSAGVSRAESAKQLVDRLQTTGISK